MRRREFLLSLAASCLPACTPVAPGLPPGSLLGPSLELGHRLRGRDFPTPEETRQVGVAIIGGGVAGLTAAWKLGKAGVDDYRLFELEHETGGNARAGHHAISPFPWGAHYLPLPGPEAREVRELLADLGVLRGDPQADHPDYDERHLCFAPQERLFRHGLWQEGLLPQIGVGKRDLEQYQRFFDLVERYRRQRDRSGRPAFAIPAALSSRDPALLELDRYSMHAFLLRHGLDSEPLHWYVNYGCRDDYGSSHAEVSAWAGLHYFASRAEEQVLTWPEGNAWLTRRMRQPLGDRIATNVLVYRIEEGRNSVELDVYLTQEQRSLRWQAKQAIFAAPLFVLPHVMEGLDGKLRSAITSIRHSPWLVANLSVREPLAPGNGAPLSWDNVLYDSPALGYVNAMHQSFHTAPGPLVLTYYQALTGDTNSARRALLETSREVWVQRILADLARPHPDLRDKLERLDIWRWGHAMSRPFPGWLWSAARQDMARPRGRIHLAHADLSGFSIFEEANYWGMQAAGQVLENLHSKLG